MSADNYPGTPWTLKMLTPLEPGIVCKDIDRMLDFYVSVIGLKLVSDAETPADLSERFGTTPHGYRIVRLQTPYGERIKFVQPKQNAPEPEARPKWIYDRHGLSYLTFVIPDINEAIAHLSSQKVVFASEEAVEVRPGVLGIFFLDPEENFVEFVEYPDIASYRPDLFRKS